MAKEHQALPFGGGAITDEEFLGRRLGCGPAHEDPNYQTDLKVIAADLDCLIDVTNTPQPFNSVRRFDRTVKLEPWHIIQAATRRIDVRQGQQRLTYRLGCEYRVDKVQVYGRYFGILRNGTGDFSFSETAYYANDTDPACLTVATLLGLDQPTSYDLHELQLAVLSLEVLEIP